MTIAAVVLAAGRSARLGRAKQQLRIGGVTLVRRALDAVLDAGCRPVVLVVAAGDDASSADAIELDVQLQINDEPAAGMSRSIGLGVAALAAMQPPIDALAIVVCDQPALSAAVLRRLRAAFEAARPHGASAAACAYADSVGTPALFDATCMAELLALRGDRGAKRLLLAYGDRLVRVAWEAGGRDIDRPEDLAAL